MISKGKQKTLFIIALVVLGIAAIISQFPEAIDTDLTKIGNGKKSVVFIYDINLVVSNQQTTQINAAREVIGDDVNFLVTRVGYPVTAEFMARYNAEVAELLFFDESGGITDRKFAVVSADSLVKLLKTS